MAEITVRERTNEMLSSARQKSAAILFIQPIQPERFVWPQTQTESSKRFTGPTWACSPPCRKHVLARFGILSHFYPIYLVLFLADILGIIFDVLEQDSVN